MENILFRLLRTLNLTPDIDTCINNFLRELGEFYQAERAYIIEYNFINNTLSNTFEWCAPGIESSIELLQNVDIEVVSEWNDRFNQAGDFCISSIGHDLDESSMDYKLLEMQGIESLMAAPLIMHDRIVGFVGVDNPRNHMESSKLLRGVADFVLVELDRRRMVDNLRKLNSIDALTGAKNRYSYMKQIRTLRDEGIEVVGVINVDVNSLSHLNSYYGYQYGDNVLKSTAEILFEEASPENVYRLGSDEFIALFFEIEEAAFEATSQRIRQAFAGQAGYTVSIGAYWGNTRESLNSMITQVNELMNAEKVVSYQKKHSSGDVFKRNELVSELLKEIDDGRYQVYLQPQVNLATGKIIGAEALIRKFDAKGKMIPPLEFVPFYEALGLQCYLDNFVLTTIAQMLSDMPPEKRPRSISVNLSRSTIQMPDLTSSVANLLDKYNIDPKNIMLEITEGVAKNGYDHLKQIVNELRSAGLRVSLDDFGTEYSNMAVLINMEFDEIKLDKSMIDQICTDFRCKIVLQSIIDMCAKLDNMEVLAEGIETPEQAEKLLEINCKHGQGYLFQKPMPMADFVQLITNEQANRLEVI